MALPPWRLISLAEFAFRKDKDEKQRAEWDDIIDTLERDLGEWLVDPSGTARGTVGVAPAPLWYDEDEAGAEALALTVRLGASSRG